MNGSRRKLAFAATPLVACGLALASPSAAFAHEEDGPATAVVDAASQGLFAELDLVHGGDGDQPDQPPPKDGNQEEPPPPDDGDQDNPPPPDDGDPENPPPPDKGHGKGHGHDKGHGKGHHKGHGKHHSKWH